MAAALTCEYKLKNGTYIMLSTFGGTNKWKVFYDHSQDGTLDLHNTDLGDELLAANTDGGTSIPLDEPWEALAAEFGIEEAK